MCVCKAFPYAHVVYVWYILLNVCSVCYVHMYMHIYYCIYVHVCYCEVCMYMCVVHMYVSVYMGCAEYEVNGLCMRFVCMTQDFCVAV